MGVELFTDVRHLVNTKRYRLYNVPSTYGPVESYFLDPNQPGPVFYQNPYERCEGRYTISAMVDMYFNKVDFTIDNLKDLREIERYLGVYISVMSQNLEALSKEQQEYIKRAYDLFLFLHGKVELLNNREKKLQLKNADKSFAGQVLKCINTNRKMKK